MAFLMKHRVMRMPTSNYVFPYLTLDHCARLQRSLPARQLWVLFAICWIDRPRNVPSLRIPSIAALSRDCCACLCSCRMFCTILIPRRTKVSSSTSSLLEGGRDSIILQLTVNSVSSRSYCGYRRIHSASEAWLGAEVEATYAFRISSSVSRSLGCFIVLSSPAF